VDAGPAEAGLAAAAPPKIDDMMFPNTDIFLLPMLKPASSQRPHSTERCLKTGQPSTSALMPSIGAIPEVGAGWHERPGTA
jgi:hypothetical protein